MTLFSRLLYTIISFALLGASIVLISVAVWRTSQGFWTGEGALDTQTLAGKTIAGVCRAAQAHGVPVVAFGGKVSLDGAQLDALGLLSAFALADAPLSLEECMARSGELLEKAVERALRLWRQPH